MGRAPEDRVVLTLTGAEAEYGLALSNFGAFVDQFRRALREFDRTRRAERTRRGGHPTSREDLVTAFRIVGFAPGSAIIELEPIRPAPADEIQEALDAELLPIETLRALMDSLEREEPVDAAVADAVAAARRTLGEDGVISIAVSSHSSPTAPRRVTIDRDVIADLNRRVRLYTERPTRISGRLHAIDLEPERVQIRASDGIDWICSYPSELEDTVKSLVDETVWARGVGRKQSASRGTLNLQEIHHVGKFTQTELFTFERIPLSDLIEKQGILHPQGRVSVLPDDASDEELDAFLDVLLED